MFKFSIMKYFLNWKSILPTNLELLHYKTKCIHQMLISLDVNLQHIKFAYLIPPHILREKLLYFKCWSVKLNQNYYLCFYQVKMLDDISLNPIMKYFDIPFSLLIRVHPHLFTISNFFFGQIQKFLLLDFHFLIITEFIFSSHSLWFISSFSLFGGLAWVNHKCL